MGVDVTAMSGFGVKLTRFPKEFDKDNLEECLEDVLHETKFGFLIDGSYYNGKLEYFIVVSGIEEAIDKGNGFEFLQKESDGLEEFLKKNDFGYKGVPNIVHSLLWS